MQNHPQIIHDAIDLPMACMHRVKFRRKKFKKKRPEEEKE